jgi:hypothetical protein
VCAHSVLKYFRTLQGAENANEIQCLLFLSLELLFAEDVTHYNGHSMAKGCHSLALHRRGLHTRRNLGFKAERNSFHEFFGDYLLQTCEAGML